MLSLSTQGDLNNNDYPYKINLESAIVIDTGSMTRGRDAQMGNLSFSRQIPAYMHRTLDR